MPNRVITNLSMGDLSLELTDITGDNTRFALPTYVHGGDMEVAVTNTSRISSPSYEPNGVGQALTIDETAGGVQLAAFPADTTHVMWTADNAAEFRVTFGGEAPTATAGMLMNAGGSGLWSLAMAQAAKFIRTGATSAKVYATPLKAV